MNTEEFVEKTIVYMGRRFTTKATIVECYAEFDVDTGKVIAEPVLFRKEKAQAVVGGVYSIQATEDISTILPDTKKFIKRLANDDFRVIEWEVLDESAGIKQKQRRLEKSMKPAWRNQLMGIKAAYWKLQPSERRVFEVMILDYLRGA